MDGTTTSALREWRNVIARGAADPALRSAQVALLDYAISEIEEGHTAQSIAAELLTWAEMTHYSSFSNALRDAAGKLAPDADPLQP